MIDDECFVYLFGYEHATHGYVAKVGISSNPDYRLSQVRAHNPEQVECLFAFKFFTRDIAREIEGKFHRHFAARAMRNEWFRFDSAVQAQYFLSMHVGLALDERYPGEARLLAEKMAGVPEAHQDINLRTSTDERDRWFYEWMDAGCPAAG